MANYMLVDTDQLDADLASIADKIRAKGGTSALMNFPAGYRSAIDAIPTSSPTTLKFGVLRPDAVLAKTVASYDKYLVADENITIPEYTTTSTTLIASSTIGETYSLDYSSYNYFVLVRCLTIPEYNIDSKAKGRFEYGFTETAYEVVEIPAGAMHTLIDPTKATTSATASLVAVGAFSRILYWSSGTATAAYSTAAYGTVQSIVAPTLSSGVLTFNTPNLNIRGSSTYFTSTYFSAVTDIRYQYIIEVWRSPKGSLNLNGYMQTSQALHIIDCAHSVSQKLT